MFFVTFCHRYVISAESNFANFFSDLCQCLFVSWDLFVGDLIVVFNTLISLDFLCLFIYLLFCFFQSMMFFAMFFFVSCDIFVLFFVYFFSGTWLTAILDLCKIFVLVFEHFEKKKWTCDQHFDWSQDQLETLETF